MACRLRSQPHMKIVMRLSTALPCGILTALMGGALYFSAGFFGPLWLRPSANQGPLFGIFFSGPVGVVGGGAVGITFSLLRVRPRTGVLAGALVGALLSSTANEWGGADWTIFWMAAGILTFGVCGLLAATATTSRSRAKR